MLGIKTLTTTVATGGASADFATNQLAAGQLTLGFNVEEQQMLIDLGLRVTYYTATPALTYFTLFVDGVDVEAVGANGLSVSLGAVAGAAGVSTVYFVKTVALARGYHTVEVRQKCAEAVTYAGAIVPCELVARRHSHPATLGHGVDSKVQLIQ